MHEKESNAVINAVEMRRLKNNRYGQDFGDESWKTYVIKNKKNGKIAELKAASPVHAAKLIGWRRRHTTVLETKDPPEEQK